MATNLNVAANASNKTRDLSAERIPFPFDKLAMFSEQLKSKYIASNVNFDPRNAIKWLQEWTMMMDGQPLLTAAIKYKKPEETEEQIHGSVKYQKALAMWTNSDYGLKSKLLEACHEDTSAKNHVIRMNTAGSSAIEILQRLLNDYAKISNHQTQKLQATLLGPKMDFSKSKTPGLNLITMAEMIQGDIIDAGGECSNEYLRSVVLDRAKRTKPLELIMHAYEQACYAMEKVMTYEQLRTRIMTADSEIKVEEEEDTATETKPPEKEASNAETDNKKKKRRCDTCKKFHFGVCRFLKSKEKEANEVRREITCDFCKGTNHTEDRCFEKQRYERQETRRDREDDDKYRERRRDQPLKSQRDGGRRVVFHERSDYKRRAHAAEREETDDFDNDYYEHRRGNMFASQAHVLMLQDKDGIVDSGATDIFAQKTTRVDDYQSQRENMTTAKSGSSMDIIGRGTLADGDLPVSVCDQRLIRNLIGVAPVADLDYTFTFNKRECRVSDDKNPTRVIILPRRGNLYPCNLQDIASFVQRSSSSTRRLLKSSAYVEREEDEFDFEEA